MPGPLIAALPSLIGNLPGLLGSLFGAKSSGTTRLNNANAKMLEELLRQFRAAAPVRQGLQTSMLGRLPDYMRQNFPSSTPKKGSGFWNSVAQQPPGPDFPQY
jgi:hypothetical protein